MTIIDMVTYVVVGWWVLGVVCIGVLALSSDIKNYKEIKYGNRLRLKNARRNSAQG